MTARRSAVRTPRSIRAQLIALVATMAVPLLALQVWSSYREYVRRVDQAERSALAVAQSAATSTREFVSVAERTMTGLATELGGQLLDPERCPSVIQASRGVFSYFVNVLSANAEGTVVCSALPVPGGGSWSVSTHEWFQNLLKTRRFTVGNARFGGITKRWVVALATPIMGQHGELLGIVGGSIDLERFQQLLTGAHVGPGDLVTIADSSRVVVARSRDPEDWVGQVLPPDTTGRVPVGEGYALSRGPDFDGVDRAWGMVHMPELGWYVYAGTEADRVYGPALAASVRHALLSLAVVVLAVLLSAAFYRRIAASLQDLVSSTRAASDGTAVVLHSGAPSEVLAVAEQFNRTLAGRTRAEFAERRAKERYRSILDNAVFGIYVSTADGRFLEVNPAMVAMLGYDSPGDLILAGPNALYRTPEARSELVALYRDRPVISDLETEWLREDGRVITVRLNGRTIHTDGGEVAFEVIVEDITREKRREAELRQTQRMEAMGRLAGGIAHDFNNLLTVIGGNTQLLLQSLPKSDPLLADASAILDATDRASALTRQLLAFSRKTPVESRVVDLEELLKNLENMLGRLIGEDVVLTTRAQPGVRSVKGDPGQIEQIVMNLVINARDALPDGGNISILARNFLSTVAPSDVETPVRGDWVVLSVADDGHGMTEEIQARIFEPFFTTKSKGQGTGLGLSTVYGIVRQAGGYVAVDSAPGRGSRFDVWLPAAEARTQGGTYSVASDENAERGHETILAVEDEEPVRRIVARVLKAAGYCVLLACDGQDALELARRHDGDIDLVVTDVVMPVIKGTELADRLAEIRPDTPVLFMSGYTDNLPIQERVARDPDAFLPKPFSPGDLRQRVRRLLDRRAAGNPSSAAL